MKLYGNGNQELMTVSALTRDGDSLMIKGKIFGTMPMTAKLHPGEARKALKMLDLRTMWFLVTFLFRRGPQGSGSASNAP